MIFHLDKKFAVDNHSIWEANLAGTLATIKVGKAQLLGKIRWKAIKPRSSRLA